MSRRTLSFRLFSSAAAILILAAGCSDQNPTASQLETGYNAVALPAAELAPSFSRAGGVRKLVGPDGGEIRVGRVAISFPKGALAEPTMISVSPAVNNLAVTFGPHGLHFPAGSEPTLTFSYQGIGNVPEHQLTVLYMSEAGLILEELPATVDTREGTATRRLAHFSQYVLAWP